MARVLAILGLLSIVGLAGPAEAKVATPTLAELRARADAIALVEVRAIHQVAGLAFAEAVVLTPYKGVKKGQRIVYLAERTWACDISGARKGERALLFLETLPAKIRWMLRGKAPSGVHAALDRTFGRATARYQISTAGRGRLAVHGATVERGVIRWPFGKRAPLSAVAARL